MQVIAAMIHHYTNDTELGQLQHPAYVDLVRDDVETQCFIDISISELNTIFEKGTYGKD